MVCYKRLQNIKHNCLSYREKKKAIKDVYVFMANYTVNIIIQQIITFKGSVIVVCTNISDFKRFKCYAISILQDTF